jgi:hypothetical protein
MQAEALPTRQILARGRDCPRLGAKPSRVRFKQAKHRGHVHPPRGTKASLACHAGQIVGREHGRRAARMC